MYDPEKVEMIRKGQLQETLTFLSDHEDAIPFAGGTDLMVVFHNIKSKQTFVMIDQHKELNGICCSHDEVVIGSTTDFGTIKKHKIILDEFPMLAEAAGTVGAIAIQNRATIAGNIVNASPAADSSPSLLCYDAELTLISKDGERRVPYAEFHQGYKQMDLKVGELVKSIHLKRGDKNFFERFRKVGTRKAMAISKVSFAGRLKYHDGAISKIRLAFGSIAPTPYRAKNIEDFLVGKVLDQKTVDDAIDLFASTINPIADIRSNEKYRKKVACNLLRDFLTKHN